MGKSKCSVQAAQLTICIPSYNRGAKALALVREILFHESLDNTLQLLVLNNSSDEGHCYQEIEQLSLKNEKLTYVRHKKNKQMHGNFLASFQLATTPLIMMVSDEDRPLVGKLQEALPIFEAHQNMGVFRPSIGEAPDGIARNAAIYPKEMLLAGDRRYGHALKQLFSGTIYNRALLTERGLIASLERNLVKYDTYPHLYLEILASASCDVASTSEIYSGGL